MTPRILVRVCLVALCVAGASRSSFAQESVNQATVSGVITDAQGAAVRGAAVIARQTETNVTFDTIADDQGRYRFPYLKIGPYEITATAAGFDATTRPVVLTVGSAFDVPLSLNISGLTDTVAVTATAALIETARSQIAGTITRPKWRRSRSTDGTSSTWHCSFPASRFRTSAARSCSPRRRRFPALACRSAASAIFRTTTSSTAFRRMTMPRG